MATTNKRVEALSAVIVELLVVIGGAFIAGFYFMLAVGVMHAQVLPAVRPVGYWSSLVVINLAGWALNWTRIIGGKT